MSSELLHHLILVSACSWLVAAVVLSISYRWLRPWLGRLGSRQRFNVLLVVSFSPLLVGAGIALTTLLPSIGGIFWADLDHCSAHHVGHDHLCVVHSPGPLGIEALLLLAGLLAVVVPLFAHRAFALVVASRKARNLIEMSLVDAGLRVLDSDALFAVTAGMVAPRVVVSRGLLEVLPEEHLKAVLAHEQAHVRRRDSMWKVLASLLSVPLLPPTRRKLLADLELAAEQVCDEEAAEQLGDRLQVAGAILAMERLLSGFVAPHAAVAPAFDTAPAVQRVELLLEPRDSSARIRFDILFVLILAIALLSASSLHHAAETLLGLLGR